MRNFFGRAGFVASMAVCYLLATAWMLCRSDVSAQGFNPGGATPQYGRTTNVASTAPYYVGNSAYSVPQNIPNPTVATNAVPANKTNGVIWLFPTDKRTYRFFSVEIMDNQVSNTTASVGAFTNYLYLYASGDEGRYNSNTPSWTSGPLVPQAGSTNLYAITNVPPGIFDNVGYVFAGFGNQGTNSITNLLVRFFASPAVVN